MKILIVSILIIALANIALTQTGAYSEVDTNLQTELRSDQTFVRAQKLARDQYFKTHQQNLGELVSVSHQVVSGVNYKMIFHSKSGSVQVTVYCQPWTQTYQVLEMKPHNQ